MKKRIILFAVVFAVLMSVTAFGAAANITGEEAANYLYDLGLLAGKGTNADGSVNFDVGGSLTRAESITQVVRFLGKESAATSETNAHPFTDLPAWAVPYVSYAYANGVTKGVSATKFDASGAMTDSAFLTAILRVLGYNDGAGDFSWNNPYELANKVGLIAGTSADKNFTRGDAFIICYNALSATCKNGGKNIAEQLIEEGLFTVEQYNKVTENVTTGPVTELLSITELDQYSKDGDHAEDDYRTASLEINYRENVVLTSGVTGYTRYDSAFYPRIRKVNDSLYVLTWMYSQYGQHLYYATSSDGINWNAPEVLWNSADHKFTYEYGSLEGTSERYHAMNADLCVLDDGSVLCVYAVRAPKGYREYPELCGLYMMRGTVDANNNLTWSDETRIYTGQVWEPSVLQLANGTIHVYYTQVAPDIMEYGYDEEHRSTETGLIISTDNGNTWSPDIQPGDTGYYRALTVYREYVGDKLDAYSGTERPHYNGQMPVATQLYNGKLMLVVEMKQLDGKFRISYGVSEKANEWKDLAKNEESAYTNLTITPNSSPYIDRFESGEVYITHNYSGKLVGRLGAPDGSEVSSTTFENAPGSAGMWGSCAVVGSHRVVTAMHDAITSGSIYGINLYYSYLNHRVNAPKTTITLDGYTNDWTGNNDALFVGSASQAQVTMRTAHDDNNVYFLLSRLDYYLTSGDTVTVCVAAGDSSDYRVTVDLSGNVTVEYYSNGMKKSSSTLENAAKVVLFGTIDDNSDKDEGAVIELSIPKTAVGLTSKTSFGTRLVLVNQDGEGSLSDTFTGVSTFSTKLWPKVVLD
ncbi:MAG: exo-alpha-sialidase [Clostridia bacterium]|nr:exo-alpha-sialidase [Clostridia bacterium]